MDRNEESRLIYLDSELTYPILISVNLLVTTPNKPPPPPPATATDIPDTTNETEISTIGTTKPIVNNNLVSDNNLQDLVSNE